MQKIDDFFGIPDNDTYLGIDFIEKGNIFKNDDIWDTPNCHIASW